MPERHGKRSGLHFALLNFWNLLAGSSAVMLMMPLRALLFGAGFFVIWRWRPLPYVLHMGVAFTLFAFGTAAQTVGVPHNPAWNFMISAVAYTAAVLALLDGCQRRVGLRPRHLPRLSAAALVLAGVAFFCFVRPDLAARLYVMNFGLGLLTLVESAFLGRAAKNAMDRVVFWMVLVLGIQGFPRTLLTARATAHTLDMAAFAHSNYWKWMNWTYAVLVVLVAATMVLAVVHDVVNELQGRAEVDPLTGLLNRRGSNEAVARQVTGASGRSFSIALCDIDGFRAINETFGRAEGDAVLRRSAQLLSENLRFADRASRRGGAQFVILLSDEERDEARALIERLRALIESTRFGNGELRRRRITASFGVAELRAGDPVEQAIARADQMLYAAKRSGRNKAVVDWMAADMQTGG